MGDGNLVLLWEDNWSNQGPLYIKFPRLYRISKLQFKSIRVLKNLGVKLAVDQIFWSRMLRPWEKDIVFELVDILASINLSLSTDYVIWKPIQNSYSTKACQDLLGSTDRSFNGNWNLVWKLKVPHKIQFFLWKMEAGALPTGKLLNSRLGQYY